MRSFRFTIFLIISLLFSGCGDSPVPRLENHQLLTVNDSTGTDSAMYYHIKPYRDSLENIMNEVIGFNDETIRSFKPESPLSSLVADLTLEAGIEFIKEQGITEENVMSLVNTRGLRTPLAKGTVTIRNAFEIMPFENQMVAVKLNYEQILLLFDHIAVSGGDGISGATFTLTKNGAEDIIINKSHLEKDESYWVITSDYIAEGGDSYFVFALSDMHLTSTRKIRELIIDYIKNLNENNASVSVDNRVRIKDNR